MSYTTNSLYSTHVPGHDPISICRALTEKGFKKIANSVDLSLKNLQGLVFKQLNGAAVNMFYFLNTIAGFGRMSHFFEVLYTSSPSLCMNFY